MSFGGQRIANTYALWTKVRRRGDSNGQKVYSPFGKAIDDEIKNLKILSSYMKIDNDILGIPYLFEYKLGPEEEINYIEGRNRYYYSFPNVLEINNFGTKELKRFSSWEEFTNSLPDRFLEVDRKEKNNDLIWSSNNSEILSIERAEHLGVTVTNSKNYKVNMSKKNNREPFDRHSCVIIKGLNEDFLEVEEYIKVFRDGYFESKNVFKEIREIDHDGFDGEINIFLGRKTEASYFRKRYPYVIAATPFVEGLVELEIVRDENNFAVLNSYIIEKDFGYERINNNTQEELDSLELVSEQTLLDESGNQISVIDYFVSPIDARIYILSTESRLHIFDYKMEEFKKCYWENTNYNIMLLEANRQRVGLNDSDYFFTNFLNNKFRIKNVKVKVYTPTGETFYLQADRTFSENEYSFSGRNQPLGAKTWDDIKFKYTFENLGQYDFNIEVSVRGSNQIYLSSVSVICEANRALRSYDLLYPDLKSIFLDKENNICVENDDNKYYLSSEHEGFFADFINQRLVFRKNYDFIKVVSNE